MVTAYIGTVTMKNLSTGEVAVQPFTCTDAAANTYWLFKNNGSNNFVNAPGKSTDVVAITDISTSISTMTNTIANLRISAKDTGISLVMAGLVVSVNNRIPTPILLKGGSTVSVITL